MSQSLIKRLEYWAQAAVVFTPQQRITQAPVFNGIYNPEIIQVREVQNDQFTGLKK